MRSAAFDLASQPLRNVMRDPRLIQALGSRNLNTGRWFGPSGSAGSYTLVTDAATAPPGLPGYVRKQWSAIASGHPGDTGFDTSVAMTRQPARPGDTLTWGYWIRTSRPGRQFLTSLYHLAADGVTGVGARTNTALSAVVPVNTWTWLAQTHTIPAGRTDTFYVRPALADPGPGTVLWAVGDTLDIAGIFGCRGAYAGGYLDGDAAGWRWTGTTRDSESAGYLLPALRGL